MDTKTTYTSDEKSIYFLTDKCLAQSLAENVPARNAVPSFTLVDSLSATAAAQAEAGRILAEDISAAAKKQIEDLAGVDAAGIQDLSGTVSSLVEATARKAADDVAAAEAAAKSYADSLNLALDSKTAAALAEAVDNAKLSIENAQNEAAGQSSAVSAAVDAAGYAVVSATTFKYDQNTHVLALEVAGKNGEKNYLSVDATAFIANSIVDHITVEDGNVNVYWKNTSGSLDNVSIPIDKLIQAYRAGDGITIEKNVSDGIYQVAADQTIARTADVARDIESVETLVSETSAALEKSSAAKADAARDAAIEKAVELDAAMDVRTKAIEAYTASLSVADGKIAQLDAADADAAAKIAAAEDKLAKNKTAVEKAQATADTGVANAKKASDEVLVEQNRAEKQEQLLSASIASNETAIANVANRASALETRATAAEAAIVEANSKIAANAASITANETATSAVAGRATALETRATSIEAAIVEANSKIAQNEAKIAANETAIAGVADRAGALETRATSIEAAAVETNSNVAAEKARAEQTESELKSAIASNAAAIQTLDQKTTSAISGVDTRTSALESKADSAASGIASLETKLTAEETRAKAVEKDLANDASKFSAEVAVVSADHEKRIAAAEPKIAALEIFKTELSSGGENPGGVVPAIRADVAALSNSLATSMAYAGKIAFSKKEPDAVLGSADAKLSSFLKGLNLDQGTETVKNGSVFGVSIMGTEKSYPDNPALSNQLFKAPQDAWYLTEDGFRLADGDAWVVVAPDGAQTVALSALNSESFRRLNSLQAADFEQAKIDAWKSFAALSGGNTIDGENAFTGKVTFSGSVFPSFIWADCYDTNSDFSTVLSAENRPNYSGAGSLANVLCAISSEVQTAEHHICVVIPDQIQNLSGHIDSNTRDVAKKIFICDKVNSASKLSSLSSQMQDVNTSASVSAEYYAALSGKYCDLSVVKIGKAEYEQLAIGPTPLKDDVLYVVESDYEDMYGQVCKNLSTAGISGTSDAANVDYVDAKLSTAAKDISNLSTSFSVDRNQLGNRITQLDMLLSNIYKDLSTWNTSTGEVSSGDPKVALLWILNTLSAHFDPQPSN